MSTDGGSPDGGYSGRWVSVVITDSIIAASKADGSYWDGIGSVDPSITQEIANALVGPSPVADVLAILAGPALANLDQPDPYGDGYATVFGIPGEKGPLASSAAPISNTFHPIWSTNWYFGNIPIDSDVRITVELWDSDLVFDDPIDTVELNSNDLKNALAAQRNYEVQVYDQGQGQLLFVGISVTQQTGVM
jgi:hypothetical protein